MASLVIYGNRYGYLLGTRSSRSHNACCCRLTCSVEPCTSSIEGNVLNGAAMLPHLCYQHCCASVENPQPPIGEAHLRADDQLLMPGR